MPTFGGYKHVKKTGKKTLFSKSAIWVFRAFWKWLNLQKHTEAHFVQTLQMSPRVHFEVCDSLVLFPPAYSVILIWPAYILLPNKLTMQ